MTNYSGAGSQEGCILSAPHATVGISYSEPETPPEDLYADGITRHCRCLYGSIERGIIRGNGARNRGDIDSHPAMQQAYEAGKDA